MGWDGSVRENEALVACNGRSMLLLRNTGDEDRPRLVLEEALARQGRSRTPRPGWDAGGSDRLGRPAAEIHDLEEIGFLRRVAASLAGAVEAGRISSIVVVAPRPALGTLRRFYSRRTAGAVRAEIGADFADLAVRHIESSLLRGGVDTAVSDDHPAHRG